MRVIWLAFMLVVAWMPQCADAQNLSEPLLLRSPTISKTQLAFAFAGDIWIAPRDGGSAARLTASGGHNSHPIFSPDGSQIAFTGLYDGNQDVYVVPASGGVPRRLTYHPAPDEAVGWSPDGSRILFRSTRDAFAAYGGLFTVPVTGGFPTRIPLPAADWGSFSPDASRLAYGPHGRWQAAWKRYRGGQTTPVWIATLADLRVTAIPRDNSNDSDPMWVGDRVFFLSDRAGPVSLFAYDTHTGRVSEAVHNTGLDIKSASAGPGAIVYEQFGSLHLFDTSTGKEQPIHVQIAGDLAEVRPHWVKVGSRIANSDISPTGARAVFEARATLFTVPAEKGDVRCLTTASAVCERDPAWSPDGKSIAYFSDASGEYALYVRDQAGRSEAKRYDLGSPPSFFYSPTWSPDSKKIAYTDKRLNLWYIDLAAGKPIRVDAGTYDSPFRTLAPAWSPDSRWIAYPKQLPSHLHAIYIYSLEQAKTAQVTDGLSDALHPCFDKSGKYVFFTASTDVGLSAGWLDMSSIDRPVSASVYAAVLRADLPSPVAPESDEEKASGTAKPDDKPGGEVAAVKIDFDGIGQRIVALPIPERDYTGLIPGKAGVLFIVEGAPLPDRTDTITLHRFDLASRKLQKLIDGIDSGAVSFNGEKLLYTMGGRAAIVSAAGPVTPGQGTLNLDGMEVRSDPRAEWAHMYHDVWRLERDFLYDPGFHGLDLAKAEHRYEPYLAGIASREDLNYLFEEMLGEITLGHVFVGGGDAPRPQFVSVGLLGADYTIENGRYRFARIYNGENWNPNLRAPLTQPGVQVAVGDYLLAVNGRELRSTDEIYSLFEATAGRQVVLKVGKDPSGAGAREVTVVPVADEGGLRHLAWIEDNRRKVDQLSGGRLAYIYLPNTAQAGYESFNRYFFPQMNRQGAIIDERFNGGGDLADYIIDYLRRPLMAFTVTREGATGTEPIAAIYGPKVMLINEMAGSGGDALPWMFRKAAIGPLVGKRTWGGLVGIYGYPPLLDGGGVTAPRIGFYGLKGEWEVENHGIAPDYDVELDPAAWRQGHDTQLEKAVAVALDLLQKHPQPVYRRPAYPNYHTNDGLGVTAPAGARQ